MSQASDKKPLVYYIHEAFKHLGTNNWTVRQQDEKPPKPTAYPNDWISLIEKSAYDKAIEALKFLASNEAYHIEDSDPETGYFDSYKGPQNYAEEILKELGVDCE